MHRNSTAAVDPARSRATLNFYGRATARPRLDFATVRAAATGRWAAILPALGVDAEFLRDRHGPCPGCGGTDRFRFDDRDGAGTWLCGGAGRIEAGDGFGLLAHCHGWTATECLHAVADVLGLREGRELPPVQDRRPERAEPDPAEIEHTRTRFNRLWRAAVPLDAEAAEPARRYLTARGLGELIGRGDLPADVRLHPACAYWDTSGPRPVLVAEAPALLALVRAPDGAPVGLHTTWLRPDGSEKAALTDGAGNPLPARKLRLLHHGAGAGAAVRLYAAGERLAVAEGIETALACRVADPSLPVWSALAAGGVAGAALPADVRDVLLIADHDAAGARAVLTLASRCRSEGRSVRVIVPPTVATEGC